MLNCFTSWHHVFEEFIYMLMNWTFTEIDNEQFYKKNTLTGGVSLYLCEKEQF